jgi:hypothetical protein
MAAPTPSPRGTSTHKGVVPQEWPAQAADTIVDTIAMVRDRTTKPAMLASRGLVYGLIVAVIGIVGAVLAVILVIRVLDNYLPGNIWTIYAAFALIFSGLGLFFLRRANHPAPVTER